MKDVFTPINGVFNNAKQKKGSPIKPLKLFCKLRLKNLILPPSALARLGGGICFIKKNQVEPP